MPDDVTLDSLAPATTQAPAVPTPAAAPAVTSAPTPPVPGPSAAAPPPAAAAPAFDPNAWLKTLGYESQDDLRRDLEFTRRFRSEADRVRAERESRDPERQQAAQRGRALRELMAEGYNPDVADGLAELPEMTRFLREQRAEAANRDLDSALGEVGVSFDDSDAGRNARQDWEDAIESHLNRDQKLNRLYFGTPADRRVAIREAVAIEERRINHVLLGRDAATLRDHAARAQKLPRAGRAPATAPVASPQRSTATDPTLRRRENAGLDSRTLGDIYSWSH
jgi:hypothetical protein